MIQLATTERVDWRQIVQRTTDRTFARFLQDCQSDRIRSCREFAEELVYLPDGPFKGQRFSVDRQPWTRLLFEQIDDAIWPEIVATAPAQCGKTLVLFVIPLLWAAVELRKNCVVGLPDEEMWGDKWMIDILPVLQASPYLESLIPTKGTGGRGGKPKEAITLTNGVTLKPMTPSGGEHTRSGFTAPVVSVTELYRFDGSPFGELKARQGAYNRFDSKGNLTTDRRLFAEGTLTSRRELPWTLRSTDDREGNAISTESEIYSPCPSCEEWILWDREHLIGWQDAASDLAAAKAGRWKCPCCAYEFGDDERRDSAALCQLVHRGQTIREDGTIEGDPPEVSRLFFRVNGFQNLLVTTAEFAAEEWEGAQLDPESPVGVDKEQYLTTKRWAIPFEAPLFDFTPLRASWLRDNRRGQFAVNVLPPDTVLYTVGIDPGKFTCWFVGMAFRANGEMAIVQFAGVDTSLTKGADSQDDTVYRAVGGCINRIFDELSEGLPCGDRMRTPDMVFVDSGWHPDVVYEICADRGAMPIIGRGRSQYKSREYAAPAKAGGDVKWIGDGWHVELVRPRSYWRLTLDADKSKLDVQAALRVEPGKPGCMQLPRMIDKRDSNKICGHLAAEVLRQVRDERGRIVEEWQQTEGRHDLLDCAGYAKTAASYLGWTSADPQMRNAERQVEHTEQIQ